MSNKVSYSNLKLKVDTSYNTFTFCDQIIEVLKYLPCKDKYDLLMVTLQKSQEEGYYNPFKLDMFFHLHLVYMYTNLAFTSKQREDETKLYDTLKSNGFIDLMLEQIDEQEYKDLIIWLDEIVKEKSLYNRSVTGTVNSLVESFGNSSEAITKIINEFDPNQLTEVLNFANAANGGNPILDINKYRE